MINDDREISCDLRSCQGFSVLDQSLRVVMTKDMNEASISNKFLPIFLSSFLSSFLPFFFSSSLPLFVSFFLPSYFPFLGDPNKDVEAIDRFRFGGWDSY